MLIFAVAAVVVAVLLTALAVLVSRDAERHGRNGLLWGAMFFVQPVVVAAVYMFIRKRTPPQRTPPPSAPPVHGQPGSFVSVYRLWRGWPAGVIAGTFLFATSAALLLWVTVTGRQSPGWVFTCFWIAAAALIGHSFVWRVAYELQIRDGVLFWRTPVRSGSIHVADVRKLYPHFWGSSIEVFEFADGKRLWVMTAKGLQEFTADLAVEVPGLPVRLGRFAEIAERRQVHSMYKRLRSP